MKQPSWRQPFGMMVFAITCWITDYNLVFADASKGGCIGRTTISTSGRWQATRGRTLEIRSVKRRNNNCHTNSCRRPVTAVHSNASVLRLSIENLRGGADQGYYDQDYEASTFPEQQDDPYATSPRRKRQYSNTDEEYYYGDQGDDRYAYDNTDPYYDDRGRPPPRSSSSFSPSTNANSIIRRLQNMVQQGDRQIGIVLLASGLVFTMMGITLFFQKALMRLGNLLFIAGVPITIGPGRTAGYFFQPQKARATGCLAVGIFLVFIGMPVFGMILELFGLLNLFGNMFPVFWAVIKQFPIVNTLFSNNSSSNNKNNKSYGRSRDRYYDDQSQGNQYYDDQRYGSGGGGDEPDDESYQGADRYY